MSTVECPPTNIERLLAPGLQHNVELPDRTLGTPERQQRCRDPPVGIGRIMVEVDGRRRAVVLADRVPGRGIQIAAQVFAKERLAGRAWRLALTLDVRAQKELGVRPDQPLRQRGRLDQEELGAISRTAIRSTACGWSRAIRCATRPPRSCPTTAKRSNPSVRMTST